MENRSLSGRDDGKANSRERKIARCDCAYGLRSLQDRESDSVVGALKDVACGSVLKGGLWLFCHRAVDNLDNIANVLLGGNQLDGFRRKFDQLLKISG